MMHLERCSLLTRGSQWIESCQPYDIHGSAVAYFAFCTIDKACPAMQIFQSTDSYLNPPPVAQLCLTEMLWDIWLWMC